MIRLGYVPLFKMITTWQICEIQGNFKLYALVIQRLIKSCLIVHIVFIMCLPKTQYQEWRMVGWGDLLENSISFCSFLYCQDRGMMSIINYGFLQTMTPL
jgi:hypothetical protein